MNRISVKMDNHIFANASPGIPAVCTVCQVPAEFPNPDNPTKCGHSTVNITIKRI